MPTFPSPPRVGLSIGLAVLSALCVGCGARARAQGLPAAKVSAPAPAAADNDPPPPAAQTAHADEDAPPSAAPASTALGPTPPRSGERRVVVLLSQSGKSRRLGEDLAAGLVAGKGTAVGPVFEIADPGGPEEAAARLKGIEERTDVSGVVAVADRALGETLASVAAAGPLPVVLLTPAEGAAAHPGHVWRALHTPALIARTGAGAALARGGKEAIILRPRSTYAETLGRLFQSAWESGGGHVAGEVVYDAGKPDWKSAVESIQQTTGDTLFLADGAVNAAQALATLASADIWPKTSTPRFERSKVRELVVIGTPDWYSPEVARQSGRYFEGALIPVPFAVESVQGAKLAARYQAGGHPPPVALDALLWDAVVAVDKAGRDAQAEGKPTDEVLSSAQVAEASVGLKFDTPDAVQALFVITVKDGRYTAAR